MKICGRGLRDHIKLLSPLFGIIAAVWALRLVLDAAGASHGLITVFSVSIATPLAILLAVLFIHMRRFGSFPNVVASVVLLVVWSQLLVILAIFFSVITGKENIFTAPEYSIPGDDPHHVRHILGHLTFGIGVAALFGSAVGCLLLGLLRLLLPALPRK